MFGIFSFIDNHMRIHNLLILFAVSLMTVSCFHVSKEGEHDAHHEILDKLHNEVMSIHDEVMPKMGEIMNFKSKARVELDSILSLGESELEERKLKLMEVHAQLTEADKAMMDWMHEFDPNIDSATHEKAIEYFKSEKKKIAEVKEIMLKAIEDSKAVLSEEEN